MKPTAKTNTDSLRIATEHYYWKPGKAFFHSFELEEYAHAGISFEHPVMDLGSGDGTFAAMLQEREILDSVDVALDYSARSLEQLNRDRGGCGVVQADARALPLKSATLASVLANDVLCSVRTDVDRVISEVYRLLADQGLFVLTVPTPEVDKTQLIPKICMKVGASWLATRYLATLNRRLDLYHVFDEKEWRKRLEEAHFHIEQIRYYFTPRQAFWSNIFALQPFRVFAFLKILKVRWIRQQAARIQEKIFQPVFVKEQSLAQMRKRDQAGWLLVVARKMSVGTSQRVT